MDFYGQKSTQAPRFIYRNLIVALKADNDATTRAESISEFCDFIADLKLSDDWYRMKWCLPDNLAAILTKEEVEKINAVLQQKRKKRNDKFLEVYPHCSDEYSTNTEFLDAVFGTQKYELLDLNTRIFTIGSCFARNIAGYLDSKGYNITPYAQVEDLNSPFSNAVMLSVSTAPADKRKKYLKHWLRILYPEDKEVSTLVDNELQRLEKLNGLIRSSDVMIITCGNVLDYFLTNLDYQLEIDTAVAPKFLSVSYKKDVLVRSALTNKLKEAGSEFRIGNYSEVMAALESLYAAIRMINPAGNIIFTLSPVPIDTAMGIHLPRNLGAVEIDCASKSLLRAALHDFMHKKIADAKLHYFPSFEIVRWIAPCMNKSVFGNEDAAGSHVSQSVLSGIYEYFLYKYAKSSLGDKPAELVAIKTPETSVTLTPSKITTYGKNMKNFLKQFSPNPKARKKAVWRIIHDKGKKYNLPVYKTNLVWLTNEQYLLARKEWGDTPGMSADRGFFVFSTAQTIRNVPGDTADIGVRYGSSSFYILKGLRDGSRQHHMFDSFEGLSAPTREDHNSQNKTAWKKGDIAVDEAATRQCMSMFSNCHFYKGWVPTRFAEVADRRFSFVHIDVDLYQPTLDTLRFFYERMNPGGVMICDDYGFSSCPGAKKAVDEFFTGKESVFHIPTGQSLVVIK